MAYPLINVAVSQTSAGDEFICAECGEGFGQYQKLITHMTIHGPTALFPSNNENGNKGSDAPIEFALHENGTLTVVDRSAVSNFSFLFGKPTLKQHESSQTPIQESLPSNQVKEKEHTQCKCERCGQVFKSQRNLQQHQRYRPLEQGFRCTLCCKIFYDRESLQNHLQNHDHERFYSCGHCGKRFLKQETLLLHQKEWHRSLGSKSPSKFEDDHENGMDKSYPCQICGLRFFWLSDLHSHLINHSHMNKSAEAKQNENITEQLESSPKTNNKSSTDNSMDRSYRCGLCGGRFTSLKELKGHHASEHPDAEHDDDEDDDDDDPPSDSGSQTKRQNVNYHGIMRQMVSKHQMQRMDPLRSRIRGRPRGSNRNLSKVFPCKQCHRVFVHSSSLSRHMRYHKGTLHTCVYCGRHFPQRCDVTRHVAMYHNSDVKVKVESEMLEENDMQDLSKSQASIDSDDLESQENEESPKSQDNEQSPEIQEMSILKPRMTYKCRECGRVFGLLSVYQRHVRYHRRDPARVLVSCPVCPCRFTFRTALERHLENHHKIESEKSGKEGTPIPKTCTGYLEDGGLDFEINGSEVKTKDNTARDVLYECTECTQTFTDLQIFLQHQSAHG
ncbi:zinc finger protein 83 [Hoplias malabaricus]|uniref:zinc finger protein 83 n=1 Tax=Hoplias malabaricus TaxID=27720 RepID=UPI003461F1D5